MRNVPLLRFDLTECPLPEESIDAVLLLNVLEHIAEDSVAIEQVHRILKPGGLAVIEVPAGPHLFDVYDRFLLHYRRYSITGLCNMVESVGFKVIRRSHLGCFVYPGFRLIKKRNKRFLSEANFIQEKIVAQNILKAKQSRFLSALMDIELILGKWFSYPFGIRCLLTCMKE